MPNDLGERPVDPPRVLTEFDSYIRRLVRQAVESSEVLNAKITRIIRDTNLADADDVETIDQNLVQLTARVDALSALNRSEPELTNVVAVIVRRELRELLNRGDLIIRVNLSS